MNSKKFVLLEKIKKNIDFKNLNLTEKGSQDFLDNKINKFKDQFEVLPVINRFK